METDGERTTCGCGSCCEAHGDRTRHREMAPDPEHVAAVLRELAHATGRAPEVVIRDLVARALDAATRGVPDGPPPARLRVVTSARDASLAAAARPSSAARRTPRG